MIQDLVSHMNKLGYMAHDVIPDGKIHRFDRNGKKKNAWFVGYQNHTRKGDPYIVAKFGDWVTKEEETYQTSVIMSSSDKKAADEDIKKAQKEKEVARQLLREESSKDAESMWVNAVDNAKSDYLARKKINGLYGCKTAMGYKGREIFVPMRDTDNKLWGIQRILPDGGKYFLDGQRKQSCFHVIPFAEALDEVDTVYIAEGFATAASIYEAIQKPVVIAFDSGNLISVAKALKQKYKDKAFIICGDDDKFSCRPDGTLYNSGRDSAELAAKEIMGKAVFPKFKIENNKPTDFNDLFLLEGIDAVRNQITGVRPEHHAVHCLGYQDDNYYFISSAKPQVTPISRGAFSKLSLMDLMPLAYWETNYPSKQGINWDSAYDDLIRNCQKASKFVPKNVRGAGVWKDKGKTVVNTGSALWIDGEMVEYREHKSKFIYQVAEKGMVPLQEFAAANEIQKLAAALERLSWKKPSSPKLLMGWLFVSGLSGCLEWRPHLWVTGPSGTGKSFVMNNVISKILKGNMVQVLGTTTEAGLRQRIGSDALPVVFDELETDDDRSGNRVSAIIELFRQASSETNGEVVKGTAHGKSIAFSVRFTAVVSSIRPNLQHEQDKNRFTLLELVRSQANNFSGEAGVEKTFKDLLTPEFVKRMYSRSVHKVDLVLQNKKTVFDVLYKKYNGRFGDQYGILIAGYFAALKDEPMCADEAKWAVETFMDLSEEAGETVEGGRDEDDLLNHIMDSIVRTNRGDYKVSELISACVNPPVFGAGVQSLAKTIDNEYNVELQRFGISVVSPGVIAIKTGDAEFKKMLKQTKWAASARSILKRIKGAETTSARFHSGPVCCVKIPIDL